MSPATGPERSPRGIQSIEVGGQLLLALAHHGRPLPLKDLAREAGMPPAKAHPYLVSFGKLGLIERDASSVRYGLGPLALQLGLISLQQFDPVRLATPLLAELAAGLGHTVAIAVWGNRGPTIVRIEEAPSPVHVNMRHGTVMSLRGTASGLLFAAHRPRAEVLALDPAPIDDGLETELAQIRQQGLAAAVDRAMPGIAALAAPVFNEAGAMVLALSAIGPSRVFDARPDGAVARALTLSAQALSKRLGAPG